MVMLLKATSEDKEEVRQSLRAERSVNPYQKERKGSQKEDGRCALFALVGFVLFSGWV